MRPASALRPESWRQLYLRGLLLHLTNPKAILVWLSIAFIAVPVREGVSHTGLVVAGCMGLGVLVFGSYAILFSTASARRIYAAIRRWLEGSLAIVFGVAGFELLTSRIALSR